MKRVLILCTGNSCRSQMAEALWRELGGGRWECHSAGSEPADGVHPFALAALAEAEVPVDSPAPRHVREFEGDTFDVVVTVCDHVEETCPVYPAARTTLHWSFEDPAGARGTDRERMAVFRRVRDQIATAVADYLKEPRKRFSDWMEQTLDHWPGKACPVELRERYRKLVAGTGEVIAGRVPLWQQLPGLIREHFQERGWEWNGIYVRDGSRLRLAHAAGPPVCAELESRGGIGTSGMCFDALLMNQTLVADDVSRWAGYVSCDDDSGLATVAGMACPIRGKDGWPVAIWDLDSTRPLAVEDALFFDRYFASLGALFKPTAAHILGRGESSGSGETLIKLDQFLKLKGLAETGGRAKVAIQAGEVSVNGAAETRRGRRLRPGDVVAYQGDCHTVGSEDA